MTRRGGKEASERRSGIGENERQLVMAQLAAQWRRSNLAKLVALRKGNHPWSKVTPRKVVGGLKRRRELNERRLGWRLAWWESTEKKETSHLLGLRGRHQYSNQHSNRNRAFCVASTAVGTKGRRTKWPNCQRKESS